MPRKEAVLVLIDKYQDRLAKICTTIHANPELGHREHKAAALLAGELAEAGFQVKEGYGGMPTAFRASMAGGEGGPVVALLAEYDALPELGHACGHNIIGTAALGAALALSHYMPYLPGTLVVLGTPAEETDGAKVTLVEKGLFAGIDAALMIHPGPETVVDAPSLALDALEFHFTGRAAHASAAPEDGINSLDAVIQTFNAINALRQHLAEEVRIHGIITQGGSAPNIVPEEAAARFYIRAGNREYLNQVTERVTNCAEGAALATGAKLKVSNFELSFDEIKNNRVLGRVIEQNLRALGYESKPPSGGTGSLDMGNVSQVVPAAHPYISIGPPHPIPHTREFAEAAGSQGGIACAITGAKLLAATAFDLLTNPQLVKEAWGEHWSGKN